jgi:hypothetical protein
MSLTSSGARSSSKVSPRGKSRGAWASPAVGLVDLRCYGEVWLLNVLQNNTFKSVDTIRGHSNAQSGTIRSASVRTEVKGVGSSALLILLAKSVLQELVWGQTRLSDSYQTSILRNSDFASSITFGDVYSA